MEKSTGFLGGNRGGGLIEWETEDVSGDVGFRTGCYSISAWISTALNHNLHLVAPGMGHVNIYRGCIHELTTQFIENGTLQDLDIGCVQDISPMPFFINFTGPAP